MHPLTLLCATLMLSTASTIALAQIQTKGTLVVIPAMGEVRHANDEAQVTFMVEEQDKDKATAASRANLKMKQGIDLLKREDKDATLTTRGYYTYPIYSEESSRQPSKVRQPISWRVGQYVDMKTNNVSSLAKTVAAAQRTLALNGVYFGLSAATAKKLDQERIHVAYKNLNERIIAVAQAMGRSTSDAVLETIDFEASGNYAGRDQESLRMTSPRAMKAAAEPAVEEPSFEPGETTVQMQVVGRVRFR